MDWLKNKTEQDQRSNAWHNERFSRIGSSEYPILLGASPYTTKARLWDIKKHKIITPTNYIQQKGLDKEDDFIEQIKKNFDLKVGPRTFISGNSISSLDGWNDEKRSIFEFKLVGKDYFDLLDKGGRIREDHFFQLVYQAFVARPQSIHYCVYSEWHDQYLFIDVTKAVFAELGNHRIEDVVSEFLNTLSLPENPFGKDESEEIIENEILLSKMKELDIIEDDIAELEKRKSEIRKLIAEIVPDGKAKCGDFSVSWSERKGNVDYSKVPELKGVNLDPYRKPSSKVMTVKRGKNAT